MVRKRSYYTRQRAKRSRPKTPAPKSGWVIAELARLAEIPRRRVRYYLEHELITPTEFRGTATRYQRRELMRLLGIVRLRADTRAKLADIKRRLDTLGERELEAWLRTQPLPLMAASALGLATSASAGGSATQAVSAALDGSATQSAGTTLNALDHLSLAQPARGAGTPGVDGFAWQASTWRRVCLLPGLELAIAADASPAVVRAAQRICEEYVGVGAPLARRADA